MEGERETTEKVTLSRRSLAVGRTDHPLIISASRATDLPAFEAEWLRERLRAGYADRRNPFNGRLDRIAFDRARVFVFWSKNPAPLLPLLTEWDHRGISTIFHFTLNDYEREGWEPGVPPLEERIRTFERISERVGKARVIWRFDPLILSDGVTIAVLLDRIAALADRIRRWTEKLVFSFLDLERYGRVHRRVARADPSIREFREEEQRCFAEGLARLNRSWGLQLATCAEVGDLSLYGISHNRCVDDVLFRRLFSADHRLIEGLGPPGSTPKDPGQRSACGCVSSRDIGAYRTCRHGCLYCYAR